MPQHFRHRKFVLLHRDQIEPGKPALARPLAPEVEHPVDVVDAMGAVDEEHRLAVDLDGAVVAPRAEQIVEVALPQHGVGPVRLLLKDVMVPAVPSARPGLVGPGEAEREVEFLRFENDVGRRLEQLLAVEPVVVVAEAGEPVLAGEVDLPLDRPLVGLVVIAFAERNARLVMPAKLRRRAADVHPVGEALAPPLVVLGNGMKLREIERNELDELFLVHESTALLRRACAPCARQKIKRASRSAPAAAGSAAAG